MPVKDEESSQGRALGALGLSDFLCSRHMMTIVRSQYAKQTQKTEAISHGERLIRHGLRLRFLRHELSVGDAVLFKNLQP